jgi:hypothetical protein
MVRTKFTNKYKCGCEFAKGRIEDEVLTEEIIRYRDYVCIPCAVAQWRENNEGEFSIRESFLKII